MTTSIAAETIVRARALMAQGDLAEADATLVDALNAVPNDPELLYLRGVIASRQGAHEAAIVVLRAAIGAAPQMGLAWLALGHAYLRLGGLAEAVAAYERAADCEPSWPDPHFNLAVTRRRLNDLPNAARSFYAAWWRDPGMADAAKGCVGTLAALVRSGAGPSLPLPVMREPEPRSVSVVVCLIDDDKAANVTALYERLLASVRHEVIVLRDARSLAEAYNRGVARSTGEIVVLSHDDIDILATDFAARLLRHLERYDVVGVIGGTRMTGPLPIWAGHPHLRGWITHAAASAEWQADLLHPAPVAGAVVVLDGVLLAARRAVFAAVGFDAHTFDGFHGYDVDWSYRAAQAGYTLAAAGDLLLVHASRGRYDDVWQRYAERFCAKHCVGHIDPAPPPYYETAFTSRQQVQSFYGMLLKWAEENKPESST